MAQAIQPGASAAERRLPHFNWNGGTIANYNDRAGTVTGLTISIPTLTMAATGSQTFLIDSGQTATVNAVIGESSPGQYLTKAGSGLLTLTASNWYTGTTTISSGTLQLASLAAIDSTGGITINGPGATLIHNSTNAIPSGITLTQGMLLGTGVVPGAVSVGSLPSNTIQAGVGGLTLGSLAFSGSGTINAAQNAAITITGTDGLVANGPAGSSW